jgi:formylglycine-generating enzyme required for sulfatase activity
LETSFVLFNEFPRHLLRHPEGLPAAHPSAFEDSPNTEGGSREVMWRRARMHPDERHSGTVAGSVAAADSAQPRPGSRFPVNKLIQVEGQQVRLGKPLEYPTFGWDNEYGDRTYDVPAFSCSQFKVSNGEFMAFVEAGGYHREELWSETGWSWRQGLSHSWNSNKASHPTFWVPSEDGTYKLRTIFEELPMRWDWPVVTNFHEAKAYVTWKNQNDDSSAASPLRLMTELEHVAIRGPVTVHDDGPMKGLLVDPIMHEQPTPAANTNLIHSTMSPVNAYPPNELGFHDVFGNAWEWTEDYFSPLPQFQVHKCYPVFSTPCFDGLHHVIKAGSFVSTGDMCSIFTRFHFRPHFFQQASFRVARQEDAALPMLTSDTDCIGPYVGSDGTNPTNPFRRSGNRGLV